MAVYKIGKSWWVDFRAAGRRYRKRSPLNSKAGAEAYEATLRGRLARGEEIDAPPPALPVRHTFSTFVTEFLSRHVEQRNKAAERDTKISILELHLLPFFGQKELRAISTLDVASYSAKKLDSGYSKKTVDNQLTVLAKALRCAVEWGYVSSAPIIRLFRPRRPDIITLSPDETSRLLAVAKDTPQWGDMLRVVLGTGIRLGELRALERRDVDFDARKLSVSRAFSRSLLGTPKDDETRTIPLDDDLLDIFARVPERGLAFPREDGRPVAVSTAEAALKRLCKQAGVRSIGWHIGRHTFATDLLRAGAPMPVVQALLGHSTIRTTELYWHPPEPALYDAIDTLRRARSAPLTTTLGQPVVNPYRESCPGRPVPRRRDSASFAESTEKRVIE